MISRVLVPFVLASICACGGSALHGYTDSRAPGVAMLPSKGGEGRADLEKQDLKIPMGEDAATADNDALVLEFMDQAADAGALYVSDVQIRLFSEEHGVASDCVTVAAPFVVRDEQNRERWTLEYSKPKCSRLGRKIDDEDRPHELRGKIYLPK